MPRGKSSGIAARRRYRALCLACFVVLGAAGVVPARFLHSAGVEPPVPQENELGPLFSLYDRGDLGSFESRVASPALAGLSSTDYRRHSEAWLAQDRTPERGALVVAGVALELAHAHPLAWDRMREIVEYGCRLLRRGPQSEAEHAFDLAAVTLAESAADYRFLLSRPSDSNQPGWLAHAEHSTDRFPADPRFLLAQTMAEDYRVIEEGREMLAPDPVWADAAAIGSLVGFSGTGVPANYRTDRKTAEHWVGREVHAHGAMSLTIFLWRLADIWQRLLPLPEVAPEAHVRLGQTYRRLARPDLALAEFDAAERTSTDPYVLYLASFLRGQTLEGQGADDAAIDAFRQALRVIPRAQSASMALAVLLFHRGARDEASDVIARSVTEPLASDPFRHYSGDPDRWPAQIAAFRRWIQ